MKTLNLILVVTILFFMASCEKDENGGENIVPNGKAMLSVKMVDSPGAYDAVNIDVLRIRANYNGQWVDFPLESPGIYNLLEFINGNSLIMIGDTALLPGSISEIRLVLGSNNTVIEDGMTYDLQTPSGQSSGYKVKMDPQVLEAGRTYVIVIDFDVSRSVHQTGNGKYMLKPVVHGYLQAAVGQIAGTVMPPAGSIYVQAFNLADTIGTVVDTLSGEFLLSAVPPGSYAVTFFANTGYNDTTIVEVPVIAGQVTVMDTVFISGQQR